MRFRKMWLASLLAYLSGWPLVQATYNRLFGAWKRREMARPDGEYQVHLRAQAHAIVDEMQARRRQRWTITAEEERERLQRLGARLMDLAALERMDPSEAVELVEILREKVIGETDPCSFDHHGCCQMHGWFGAPGECGVARARELLGLAEHPDRVSA